MLKQYGVLTCRGSNMLMFVRKAVKREADVLLIRIISNRDYFHEIMELHYKSKYPF